MRNVTKRTLILSTIASLAVSNASFAIQLGVPSYFNPGDAGFTTIEGVGSKCGIAMINPGNGEINPNDGAGYDSEPLGPWVTQAQQLHTADTKVFAYVHSSYGARSISLVEGDVDAYFSNGIPVDGIFVDETDTSWTGTGSPYYLPLYNYIKAHHPGTLVCINPGAIPDGPNWMSACDIVMDYESSYSSYNGVFSPSWVFNYPSTRFWNASLSTPKTTAAVDACFATAAANNAGYLYVTDLSSSVNTYGSLPNATVWNREVADATGPGTTIPAAPTGLGATAGNAQVSLAWTGSTGAASYNVYRGTSAGSEGSTAIATGVTGTAYTNTGLSNGTKYYYKVAAVNSAGTSGMSNEASATPSTTVNVPPAPTGLTAVPGNAQVGLSWSAAVNATSYSLYRGTSTGNESATPVATGITTTVYTNTGLTNGTKYFYKVAGVDSAGTGAKSTEASAKPAAASGSISGETETISGANVTFKFNYTGTWLYYHLYLDTDRNSATGFTIGGIGGDDLVENAGLYGYTGGSGTAWSWASAGPITFSATGGVATFTFPLASIGSPSHMNVVYEVVSSTGTTSTTSAFSY